MDDEFIVMKTNSALVLFSPGEVVSSIDSQGGRDAGRSIDDEDYRDVHPPRHRRTWEYPELPYDHSGVTYIDHFYEESTNREQNDAEEDDLMAETSAGSDGSSDN